MLGWTFKTWRFLKGNVLHGEKSPTTREEVIKRKQLKRNLFQLVKKGVRLLLILLFSLRTWKRL